MTEVTSNERRAFEAWLLKDHGKYWRPGSNGDYVFGPRSPHAGQYRDRTLQLLWTVWKAAASGHETPAPHHIRYDVIGWLCSVCGGWNDKGSPQCVHTHATYEVGAQKASTPQHEPSVCKQCGGDYGSHTKDCGQNGKP